MKKRVEYIVLVLAVILVLIAVLTYIAPHLGWRVDTVVSGSMEPCLKVGSLVVTRPVKPETIKVGDIITYKPTPKSETPMTHRVNDIKVNSPLSFITKGDANSHPDPASVPARNVVGKICFHLPYAGYVTGFLKTSLGFLLGLAVPALFVITMYMRSIWQTLNKKKAAEVVNG